MDRKSIIVIIVCASLMFLWPKMIDKLLPPKPAPPASTNTVASAQSPATPQTNTAPVGGTSIVSTSAPVRTAISTNIAEELLVITNENARYTFTSRGGGLKEIALVSYPETITRQSKKNPLTHGVVTLNSQAQSPVLAVLGDENIQGDSVFILTPITNGVRAEKSLANGLRVVKDFQLGTNYLVHATVRLENSSSNALVLPAQEWVAGTATPMGWDDNGSVVGVAWYDGSKKQEVSTPWFENRTMGCSLFPERLRPKYEAGTSNVVWAAPNNQFFVLAAMPDSPAQQIVARVIHLPRPSQGHFSDTNNPPPKGYETVLIYPGAQLTPGQAVERNFNLFIGPKEYRTLARIGDRFQNNVDLVMGFGGFFGFFAKALLLAMNGLHQLLNLPYGWAIIAITIILKIVFWPLTGISTRSAQRMAALAPQMTALREKYKDDALKMQQKMSELYREHKINPVAGCLPVMIQLPVFFGFFTMLRTAIELRGASFFWATDLSKPDTLFIIPGLNFIPFGISVPEGLPINLLPLLYITTSIWQMHSTPPSPGMDPTQQKLMRWMPLMFLAILYNFSSGLALYMTINNLLTILQTRLTKKPDASGSGGGAGAAAKPQTHSALTPTNKKKK